VLLLRYGGLIMVLWWGYDDVMCYDDAMGRYQDVVVALIRDYRQRFQCETKVGAGKRLEEVG
jgi:hypothetical protein